MHRLRLVLIFFLAGPVLTAGAQSRIAHLGEQTVVDAGRTRVIAFRAAEAPETDLELPCEVSDREVLEIAREAVVGAGASIGYVRVRGVSPGRAVLTIDGASLAIEVVEPRGPAQRHEPAIVGPADAAAVWGRWTIGVEIREPDRGPLRQVAVQVSDGRELQPISDTQWEFRPYRYLAFEIDDVAPGTLDLVPVAVDAGGNARTGSTVRVRVVDPDDVIAGEAETPYDVQRPQRFQDGRMNVGDHPDASGGRFFLNSSANPAVCFPVEVHQPGWYQVMLTAAGRRAQGALPTVGIVVDDGNVSTTNGRLLDESWHRFAAGVPFRLDAGEHVITPFFANDFYVPGRVDRNLYLDRIEVARLADASGVEAQDGDGMMAGGMTMDMAMGVPGDEGAASLVVDDPYATSAAPLRIGFVRPLDGQILPGAFEIDSRCWWRGLERLPAPVVTLMINGEPAMTQRSGAPRFWVDASQLAPGANRIELVARLDSGATARTPVQTMHWPEAATAGGDRLPPRRHHRFSIHDDRWEPGIRSLLRNEHYPKERRAAAFHSVGEAVLNLPDELQGTYHVFLHVFGQHFDGAPIAVVTIRRDGETTEVGRIEAPTWWSNHRAGSVELAAGPKQLVVAFENDKFEQGKGDRNLWLQAVLLAEEPRAPDRTPPVVEVTYPPEGHRVFGADALVAEASDNASLASAQLIVDGVRREMSLDLNLKPGRFVFPLLLRGAEPGEHTVAVRVSDREGNSTTSAPRTIVVLDEPPVHGGSYGRAVHLLNRFAFGPDPDELAAILTMGETAWLADRLSRPLDDPGDLAALGAAFPYFAGRNNYEVPRRAVAHLLLTPNPARARFVLWAQNHFSTWIRKTGGNRKWDEHVAFSRLGAASFDRLLLASAESPAMLNYLDQEGSYAGRLNENYAREIMELHTLGVDGGYSQQDVTNLAVLLTGWTASFEGDGRGGGQEAQRYQFRFERRLNDGRANRVLGHPLPAAGPEERFGRVRFGLEILAAHPSTARFVSRKLAEHYVRAPAPDDLVDDLSRVFLETGGDMRAMLLAIAEHPAFWDAASSERIAQPLDYAVRQCRVTGHFQPWQVGDYLQRSGAGLFDRASPDGYPQDDASYTDSNAMVQRWRFAGQLQWQLAGLVPNGWRYSQAIPEPEWGQLVTDVIAVRLTGRLLADASNEAALELLAGGSGNRDERVRGLATFIARLPEANLR